MNVIPFSFEAWNVRAVAIDSEPWFVGADVARALGYANPSKALHDHCRGVTKRYPLSTAGGLQEVRLICESDLYRLAIRSNLPSAVQFERWVMEQVIPQIRRTGRFAGAAFQTPQTFAEALRLAADVHEHNERLMLQVKEQAPMVAALERLTEADGALCLRDAAKSLQLKPRQLTEWLRQHGWIFRTSDHWVAYQLHVDNGDLRMRTVTRKVRTDAGERDRLFDQVLLTAKGITRIARLLAKPSADPPTVEREIARCAQAVH